MRFSFSDCEAKNGKNVMRYLVLMVSLFAAGKTLAQTQALGFHEALGDCMYALAHDPIDFPLASEIEGDPQSGFVVWYNDVDGEPVYGTRWGAENGVTVCSGPEPMGPFWEDYKTNDQPAIEAAASQFGMVRLQVPVEGDYFADCRAQTPSKLLAVTADHTQRVGFKLVSSANVAESCRKFGPPED